MCTITKLVTKLSHHSHSLQEYIWEHYRDRQCHQNDFSINHIIKVGVFTFDKLESSLRKQRVSLTVVKECANLRTWIGYYTCIGYIIVFWIKFLLFLKNLVTLRLQITIKTWICCKLHVTFLFKRMFRNVQTFMLKRVEKLTEDQWIWINRIEIKIKVKDQSGFGLYERISGKNAWSFLILRSDKKELIITFFV